ncbi:MAG: glycosyltransferase family 4 protein [Armatimonadota bacterium]|nr:glycosyltransferase family 4 protein [Armatimonadota bacterium]
MTLNTLHIETGRHLYGGAFQAAHLVRGLIARGHRAALLCPEGSGIQRELDGQAPVYAVPFRSAGELGFIFRAARVIRRVKPDIVHLHSRRGADVLGAMAARLCRAPAVITSRRVDDPIRRNLWNRVRFGPLCDRVVAISEGIRNVVIAGGVPESKVSLVHSAVDVAQYRKPRDRRWFETEFGLQGDELAVGVIAQLIRRKGHAFLLRAMPDILRTVPKCRLLFFGQGGDESELRDLVDSLGLSDKIIFAGFRTDMERILPNLDLVAHPALTEGLGVSLLQAAAAGAPIVAAAAGGIPEIVLHLKTGWLIPPSDSAAISEAVCSALTDRDLAQRLARNAREHVEANFGLDQMIEGNLKVYREALAARGHNNMAGL